MKAFTCFILFFFLLITSPVWGKHKSHHHKKTHPTPAFDWDFLRERLFYAYSAYCPYTNKVPSWNLVDWQCYWCNQTGSGPPVRDIIPIFHNATNTFAYAGYLEGTQTLIVSFRGTQIESIENWISDLEAFHLTPYKNKSGIEVHAGFYDDWNRISDQVISAAILLKKKHGLTGGLITGHSLGAALAGFAVLELQEQLHMPLEMWDFGMPRIGNKKFSDYFHSQVAVSYRMVNQRDIVPHAPAQIMGYYHVPTEVWFPKNDTYFEVCDGSGEDPHCSDSEYDFSVYDHLTYMGYDERDGHAYYC